MINDATYNLAGAKNIMPFLGILCVVNLPSSSLCYNYYSKFTHKYYKGLTMKTLRS